MNREEIMRIIPHRPPMLLVDEAEKKDENSCRGSYTVKGDEWFLQGHFRYNMATAVLWALVNILRVISLFLCAQRLQIGISPHSGIKMRKMSTRIYFLHFTAIYFVKICSKIVGYSLNEFSLFITCAAILTVVSYALDFDKLSWSKKLF